MRKPFRTLTAGVLLLALILLIAACSKEQSDSQSAAAGAPDSAYNDWLTFTYDNFRIHYPPGHIRDTLFQEDAQAWSAVEKRQAMFFGLPEPTDTIDIMFYTGYGQGRSMTGRKYPFVRNDTVFFWLPSFYGPVLARYMIHKWHPEGTRFPFLKEGIIALLDFSGQNYHELTLRNIKEDHFESLADLAVDTAVNSNMERRKTAEAASFVDFIVFRYGRKALAAMYGADGSFSAVVNGLFMISVDSLQTLWLQTAEEGAALDTTGSKQ